MLYTSPVTNVRCSIPTIFVVPSDLSLCDLFFSINSCRIQHMLEVTTKQAIFVDSSISDTIRTCIVLGNHREALRVKTEFKVKTFS